MKLEVALRSDLAFLANIRLGWNRLTVTQPVAYYGMETITAIKSFIRQVLCLPRIGSTSGDLLSGTVAERL